MSDVLVLCYHAVSDRWPSPLAVSPERLDAQLCTLLGRGYVGTTFHRALSDPPAPRTLAVTFDDGFRSVLTRGRPVLDRLGLPATLFVPTALIDGGRPMSWPGVEEWMGGPHEEELAGLTWAELAELARSGWEVGSHTRTHARLTALADAPLEAELRASREECERALDRPCHSLAYPYGAVDARVAGAARRAGYAAAASPPGVLEPADPLGAARVGVYPRDRRARFRVKVSPAVRRVQASPRCAPLVRRIRVP
jgi:peptidoglycan/xylan/chitin deacetylase (PgdA/CDA1 family)